jgi:hypothetical protein
VVQPVATPLGYVERIGAPGTDDVDKAIDEAINEILRQGEDGA